MNLSKHKLKKINRRKSKRVAVSDESDTSEGETPTNRVRASNDSPPDEPTAAQPDGDGDPKYMYMQITEATAWRAFPTDDGKRRKISEYNRDTIARRVLMGGWWHTMRTNIERDAAEIQVEQCEEPTNRRRPRKKRKTEHVGPAGAGGGARGRQTGAGGGRTQIRINQGR